MSIGFVDSIMGKLDVMGIGEFSIEAKKVFRLPKFHFIVTFSNQEKRYYIWCLDLAIHVCSLDLLRSIRNLIDGLLTYLNTEIVEEKDFKKLLTLTSSHEVDEIWEKYRYSRFILEQIDTKFYPDLSAIKKKMEENFAQKNTNFILKDITFQSYVDIKEN